MGSPTNLSDRGAGEMSAAAKMHGEPLAKLNVLTRWYLLTGLFFLAVFPLLYLVNRFFPEAGLDPINYFVLIAGSQLMLTGGFGIKFLPSSLGGNPHVYNLSMALWSYWFIVVGVGGYLLQPAVESLVPLLLHEVYLTLVTVVFFVGTVLLLYNLWKTMQSRV